MYVVRGKFDRLPGLCIRLLLIRFAQLLADVSRILVSDARVQVSYRVHIVFSIEHTNSLPGYLVCIMFDKNISGM